MVQLNSSSITSIINPVELAAQREANLLCPKIVIDDPGLTLTLKLAELRIYNLCLQSGSYKIELSDLFLSELLGRKPRTARSYISKLTKLGKLQKFACKEKGKYYIAFGYEEWMNLSSSQLISIDHEFNLIPKLEPTKAATPFSLEQDTETELVVVAPVPVTSDTHTHTIISISDLANDSKSTQYEFNPEIDNYSEVKERGRSYLELDEGQEELLFPLLIDIEKIWSASGKLAQLKTEWFKTSEKHCWDDFLHETIMSEIKLVYANELKVVLAGNDYESQEEAKNIAAFATINFYEQNQESEEEVVVESVESVESVEYVAEYLPKAVGELQPVSFSQTNQNINNSTSSNNAHFPTLVKEPISDKESNISLNLVNSIPSTSALGDIANIADRIDTPNTTDTPNIKVARVCQDAEIQKNNILNTRLNLANSCQKWEPAKAIIGLFAELIRPDILSETDLANSCQNEQADKNKSVSVEVKEPVNTKAIENTESVSNQIGKSLPNTLPISQLIAKPLTTNRRIDKVTPTVAATKEPAMKTYTCFSDIEEYLDD